MTPQIQPEKTQGIVIAVHMPPESFFETTTKLSALSCLQVFIIDTSNEATSNRIKAHIQRVNQAHTHKPNIHYYKIPNRGIGYTYNFGITKAITQDCDLILLFTDDVIVKNNLPLKDIREFFYSKCDPKIDVLSLPQSPAELVAEKKLAADSGLMFSHELFKKIKFREDFLLDQIDFEFSNQIHLHGGKIHVYPHLIIDVLPIGREIKMGQRVLPPWRLYLLTRNSIFMSLENSNKIGALKHESYPQITHWGNAGFKSGQSQLLMFKAVLFGCIDGFTKHMGVTTFLQNLSGNRFSKKEVARVYN